MSIEHASEWVSEDCATQCPFFLECDKTEKLITSREWAEEAERAAADPNGYRSKVVEYALTTDVVILQARLDWERSNVGRTCSTKSPKQKHNGEIECKSGLGRFKLDSDVLGIVVLPREKRDKYTG